MATVRISHDLLYAVRHKIDVARKVEEEAIVKKDFNGEATNTFVSDSTAEIAERLTWGKHYALRASIPTEWCTMADSVTLVVVRLSGPNVKISLQSASGPLYLPPRFNPYDFPRIKENDPMYELIQPFVTLVVRRQNELDKINEKFNRLREQVLSFLKSCKSLNDAVAKFPDIMLWVPSEYKTRLEEKVVRQTTPKAAPKAAPEAPTNIDKEFIVTTGVINAITRS